MKSQVPKSISVLNLLGIIPAINSKIILVVRLKAI